MPQRIQLRRSKGWQKPAGAVVVARPTKWGNPFRIGDPHPADGHAMTRRETIEQYREWIRGQDELRAAARRELAGRDLCCWCPLDGPCHADVLIGIANRAGR